MSSGSKAPGPVLQWINELFHQEPYSFLVYGVYWFIVLSFLSPIAGVFLMFQTGLQFVWYLAGFESVVDPRGDGKELAVMITGCDSGFGQQLAFALAKRGYIVFAGCLRQEAMAQFEGEPNIVSMLMDVTKDDQVQAAAKLVDKWLTIGDCERERYLHAVVNNAGIGHGGLVDWLNLSAFQQDMDVNYFGIIRTIKAFLPILKRQAREYKRARVVNVVSMAGLVVGGFAAPYHGSKFAAEALSSCLRSELKRFHVQVVTVNPSFHKTPLVMNMRQNLTNIWNQVPPSKQAEYGDEFFQQFCVLGVDLPESVMWRAQVVEQELLMTIERTRPPLQVIIGSDAKFGLLLMRHFPVWVQQLLLDLSMRSAVKPKIMT